MSKELIDFINILLLDGEISEKEEKQVYEKANTLGIPDPECEVILESLLGQAQKKNNSAKRTVKKKIPIYQKKAALNNTDILNQNIEEELAKQQKALADSKSIQSQIDSHQDKRHSIIKKVEDFQNIRDELPNEYMRLLTQFKSKLEKSLGSKIIENNEFQNTLLYKANENSIINYFENATWDLSKLTIKRKIRYYIFTAGYYIICGYLAVDWIWFSAEDGGIISDEQWMGFKWWQILIAAFLSAILGQMSKEKISKKELDFNTEDIKKKVNELLTDDLKEQLKLYNELKKELNSNNNLKSRKFK